MWLNVKNNSNGIYNNKKELVVSGTEPNSMNI